MLPVVRYEALRRDVDQRIGVGEHLLRSSLSRALRNGGAARVGAASYAFAAVAARRLWSERGRSFERAGGAAAGCVRERRRTRPYALARGRRPAPFRTR